MTAWPTERLGRLARLRVSNVDKKSVEGERDVLLCNYTDVYNNEIITSDLDFMIATATDSQARQFGLRAGDTVFTKDSETADDIGVPAFVADDVEDLVCGYHLAIASPERSSVDPRYLYWAMASAEVRQQWTVLASGVTRVGLRSDDMTKVAVPVPPLDEQRRIADFLDAETARIEGLIALRARQREVLREELFARLEDRLTVPYARNRVPLMRLTDPQRPIQYGIVLPGPDWPGGVPIIKGGDIGARRLSPELLNRTDPEIESRYVRSRVRGGDYVVAIRGSVGEIAPVPGSLNGANLTQDSARIAPYECDAGWLGAVLQTPDLQNQMKRQTTGATIKGINISELRRLRVPAPSREAQEHLGRWASAHTARADAADQALHSSVSLMTERRQALITAAVTGQIDVTTVRLSHR